jgi:hypothetical protein
MSVGPSAAGPASAPPTSAVSAVPTAPSSRFGAENLRDMLRHGLITAVFCCLIAGALTLSEHGNGNWADHLVYSLAIGMLSWLFIDISRLLITGHRDIRWPLGGWGYLLVAVGVTFGFLGGNFIGDAWIGAPMLDFAGQKLATGVVITVGRDHRHVLLLLQPGQEQAPAGPGRPGAARRHRGPAQAAGDAAGAAHAVQHAGQPARADHASTRRAPWPCSTG